MCVGKIKTVTTYYASDIQNFIFALLVALMQIKIKLKLKIKVNKFMFDLKYCGEENSEIEILDMINKLNIKNCK